MIVLIIHALLDTLQCSGVQDGMSSVCWICSLEIVLVCKRFQFLFQNYSFWCPLIKSFGHNYDCIHSWF